MGFKSNRPTGKIGMVKTSRAGKAVLLLSMASGAGALQSSHALSSLSTDDGGGGGVSSQVDDASAVAVTVGGDGVVDATDVAVSVPTGTVHGDDGADRAEKHIIEGHGDDAGVGPAVVGGKLQIEFTLQGLRAQLSRDADHLASVKFLHVSNKRSQDSQIPRCSDPAQQLSVRSSPHRKPRP